VRCKFLHKESVSGENYRLKKLICHAKRPLLLTPSFTLVPINESALLISFGNRIDERINLWVMEIHHRLHDHPFHGFVESVPAYASLAVYFDLHLVVLQKPPFLSAFDYLKNYFEQLVAGSYTEIPALNGKLVEIPVLYDGEDLERIAQQKNSSIGDVIACHASLPYRVYMIGFLPGFAYLGSVDAKIAVPRRSAPRTVVPAGSVGIAGFQTGIYPQASPGGWQLIGRTPIRIFNKEKPNPCLFNPGDTVKFYPIDAHQFHTQNEY